VIGLRNHISNVFMLTKNRKVYKNLFMELMRMKICIFGAGAIGGFLASYLSREKHEVSVVSRGANLEAFKKNGLTLNHADNTFTVNPIATADTQEVGPVDIIFITVKGPALRTIGLNIEPLLKNETQVVFAMNGIPWWYDIAMGRRKKTAANLLDPDGQLRRIVGINRVLGCVVDCPATVSEPGVIVCKRNTKGKFTLGVPRSENNPNAKLVSEILKNAKMLAPVSIDIEQEIWAKLVVNLSRSPLAVLTGVDEVELAKNSETTAITREMIKEANQVALVHGIRLDLNWNHLLRVQYRSKHRSSMLQDWDVQRPMEIDSIIKIVSLFAEEADIRTPTIDRILALLTIKAREVGLYS